MTTVPPSIFTKIINREIPADIVYEDDTVIAFLTIEPVTLGHTLVVPKVPFVNLLDGNEVIFGHLMGVAQAVGRALIAEGFGDGINLIMNNGASAGQEVFHAHLHVVPRKQGDDAYVPPNHKTYRTGEAREVASRLKENLAD